MVNVNPLDLFSDQPITNGIGSDNEDFVQRDDDNAMSSSPVQTEETTLLNKYNELLELRNELKTEVEQLEIQWNEKHTMEMANMEKEKNEEQDLVLRLLLQAEQEEANQGNEEGLVSSDSEESDGDEDEDLSGTEDDKKVQKQDLITFDPSEYDARPLRDWTLRIAYLKKLYPFLSITEYDSRLSVNYQEEEPNKVLKIISFKISYDNLIIVRVKLDLDQNQEIVQNDKDNDEKNQEKVKEYYSLKQLSVEKVSNNSLNTTVNKLIQTHQSQKKKNINEFLYQLNHLYELILERFNLISALSQQFNHSKKEFNDILVEDFHYEFPNSSKKNLVIIWNLSYNRERDLFECTVNANMHNKLLLKHQNIYGELEGTRKFIEAMEEIECLAQ